MWHCGTWTGRWLCSYGGPFCWPLFPSELARWRKPMRFTKPRLGFQSTSPPCRMLSQTKCSVRQKTQEPQAILILPRKKLSWTGRINLSFGTNLHRGSGDQHHHKLLHGVSYKGVYSLTPARNTQQFVPSIRKCEISWAYDENGSAILQYHLNYEQSLPFIQALLAQESWNGLIVSNLRVRRYQQYYIPPRCASGWPQTW
jgi:hypothetical protein